MNDLMLFENEEYGKVNILVVDGEPMFRLKDVAHILGIKNYRDSISGWSESYVKKITNKKISNVGNTDSRKLHNTGELFLTEAGFYKLIFKSRKPNAEAFQLWVTNEVLTTIRKTGGYIAKGREDDFVNAWLDVLPETIKKDISDALKQKNKLELKKAFDLIGRKKEFAEKIANSKDTISMAQMSDVLASNGYDIGRSRLYDFLKAKKILKKDNTPYQRYLSYFKTFENVYGGKIKFGVRVTIKGQAFILKLFETDKKRKVS